MPEDFLVCFHIIHCKYFHCRRLAYKILKKKISYTFSFFTFIDITQFSSWKMCCVSFPLANVPCIRILRYFFITCVRTCLYQYIYIKVYRALIPALMKMFSTLEPLARMEKLYFVSETPIMPIIFHQSQNVFRCFW